MYPDGDGLYLRIKGGRKSWTFRYEIFGKRREMGLGAATDVKLSEAREQRLAFRRLLARNLDPLEERRLEEERRQAAALAAKVQGVTFGEFAESVADAIAPKADDDRGAWLRQMKTHVGELAQMSPANITTDDVLKAVKPYWKSRPEAGRRMRMRIEKVLDAARAKGLIASPWENPARLKGHLEHLLPDQEHEVQNRLSMAYDDIPDFMVTLRALERPAAPLVEFIILTCVRNGEARGATWKEIDWDDKVWVIPKDRMKMKRDHIVPLTDRAIAILESVKPADPKPDDWIFWSTGSRDGMFSENACQKLLEAMDLKGKATTHGFRATFKTWATETTTFNRDVIEMCLAHKVMKGAEGDYWRGDALEKRLEVMKAWETYLAEPKAKDNVVRPKFRRRA